MSDDDFVHVRDIAARSRLWQMAGACGASCACAWARSRVARLVTTATAVTRTLPPGHRVRIAATIAAWAGVGYLLILTVAPAYVVTGLPAVWPAAAALAAAAVALLATPLVQAWPTSALGRVTRWTMPHNKKA